MCRGTPRSLYLEFDSFKHERVRASSERENNATIRVFPYREHSIFDLDQAALCVFYFF